MIQSFRAPVPQVFFALILSLSITLVGFAKPHKSARSAPAARTANQKKGGNDRAASRASAKTRSSAREKRRTERASRTAKKDKLAGKGKLSRRERMLEARREAERRQREREEAARRAELARQAALARIRALNQSLRDETAANILLDDTTGEDQEVRRVAVNALGGHAGTVVVMDPKTGRVYTIVNQEWALRRGFKPCSTIKLVTGLAGLSEKVISPPPAVNYTGINYDSTLTEALARSSNPYFQNIGGTVGFERMMLYARELGLGERTGINHANEYPGRIPLYKSGYAVNHMSSHGDDFEVTPLQLATLISALANGGKLLVPHLPRTPEEDVNFKTEVKRRLNVPREMMNRLVPGMIGAVNYGTGKLAYDWTQTVAGKTGSCIGQGTWLGLFTSYAPVHDPRLAIVVITRGSSARGRTSAGIAGQIYRVLNYRFGRKGNEPLAAAPGSLVPRRTNPSAVIIGSTEETEAEAATTNSDIIEGQPVNGSDASSGKVHNVLKPIQTRPTDVTTQPMTKPQTSTAPTTANPSSQTSDNARPRRVLTTSP